MNKKGFTLVELMAVIVILGILMGVAVPNALGIYKNMKIKYFCEKVSTIEQAATLYGQDKYGEEVTTNSNELSLAKVSVLDLVKVKERVVPVGRLDMYTSGALILTNDGDFVYKVTHPKHEITKTYTATVRGIIENDEVEKLRNGVEIEDYKTRPAKVKILKTDEEKNISRLEITIHEGKNRQVRKMCEAVGSKVVALHRSKIGDIGVKDLKLGTWRYLKDFEVKKILK